MQISKLPQAETVNDHDLTVIVQDGETKNIERKDFVGVQTDGLSLKDYVLQLTSKGEAVGNAVSIPKPPEIIVDQAINPTSPNPVSSKGVADYINSKEGKKYIYDITELKETISGNIPLARVDITASENLVEFVVSIRTAAFIHKWDGSAPDQEIYFLENSPKVALLFIEEKQEMLACFLDKPIDCILSISDINISLDTEMFKNLFEEMGANNIFAEFGLDSQVIVNDAQMIAVGATTYYSLQAEFDTSEYAKTFSDEFRKTVNEIDEMELIMLSVKDAQVRGA